MADTIRAIDTVPEPPKSDAKPIVLADRLREVPDWLATDPKEAFDHFHTGAFVLQSLPSAFFCFLRSPDDPRPVILTAANCGHDTDRVASMAGNLVGAWVGHPPHGALALGSPSGHVVGGLLVSTVAEEGDGREANESVRSMAAGAPISLL